ncbi:hypothetical protein [uncultured Tissierella sp.]|uniref:hypothetical protein n=1 Tax=uncultured Tissierella sp. TaxID=448160 RepID=UPI002805D382|nr:hypothetical protein [uncultured Tissierella sp.]MDU5080275.1 hypothetical protein [Bacillota bacterium]
MTDLRLLVENELGYSISDTQMDKSEKYARRKLSWIISREGDNKGKRLEPKYLAKLIAETFFTDSLTQMNTKKIVPPTKQTQSINNLYSYCSMFN